MGKTGKSKNFNRCKLLLTTMAFILPIGANTLAVDNDSISASKVASLKDLTTDQRETTVTISILAKEYKNKVDVVFCYG